MFLPAARLNILASFGPDAKEAIPALKELKFHEKEEIRKAAIEALKKIEEK